MAESEIWERKPKNLKITKYFFKCIDLKYIILEKIWHLFTRICPLIESEIEAASKVFPAGSINYEGVRIASGWLLKITPWLHHNRPFVTFRTINIPPKSCKKGDSRLKLYQMVHELTHVYQFNIVGSIYMWQALRAQGIWGVTDAYDYGKEPGLKKSIDNDKLFKDFNREQQAQIAQDYYKCLVNAEQNKENKDVTCKDYMPFINELRKGEI